MSLDVLSPDPDVVSRPLGIDDIPSPLDIDDVPSPLGFDGVPIPLGLDDAPISTPSFGIGGTSIQASSPFRANLQAS